VNTAALAPLDSDAPAPRDRPFNAFRCPKSDAAGGLVATAVADLEGFEARTAARRRKRRADDQLTFEATVATILTDLVHRDLTEPGGWVAVPLSKAILGRAGRYRAPALGKTLPATLERMAAPELALVELVKGHQGHFGPARQTTMRAGQGLLRRIEAMDLSLADLGRQNSDEVVILKSARESVWDGGDWIEYEDTDVTRRYRAEMERINAWLEHADIAFEASVAPDRTVDDSDRRLRRYFNNGSFESGGRLFGGFWQELKKRQRREGIAIDGQAVVTLDYSQMGPRVLYGLANTPPPSQDAYVISGLERHRAGIKKLFNSLLFATKPIERFPKETRDLFPRRSNACQVIEQITAAHMSVSHLFCTGIGFKVMFIESTILIGAMLELIDRDELFRNLGDGSIRRRG